MEPEELRYADGPSTEAEIVVEAATNIVWALISDINLPARFSPEFQGAHWVDGAAGPAEGASFEGRNRHSAIGEWTTISTVVSCEPDRCFGWVIGDPAAPQSQWRFTLEAIEAGTLLKQWMRMGPSRSGLSPAIDAMPDKESKIIRRRLNEHHTNMTANLEGIKALAEAMS